jgi:hypothetical protein
VTAKRTVEHGQFWTNDNVDVYLNWEGPRLVSALDSVFCSRTPTPEADSFRDLHRRLTELWMEVAQQLSADCGAWLVALLDDPAAVDPLRYQKLHQHWLQS